MRTLLLTLALFVFLASCSSNEDPDVADNRNNPACYTTEAFVLGADLSYVNQILDHGGVYRDSGAVEDPYRIFKQYGANVIRFRLFHTPAWTKDIYGAQGTRMYHDPEDVKEGIERTKALGMKVLLDFHYSDTWADPHKQIIPEAWEGLDLEKLHDSVYNYTVRVLSDLNALGLMPEYVQVGNEINPGFLLPVGDRWERTDDFIYLLNAGIKAVRDVSGNTSIKPGIMLHIAQPENVNPWFDGLSEAGIMDFDIIGFSYYSKWSSIPIETISTIVKSMKSKFQKEVMILETAYPWTTGYADDYPNIFGASDIVSGYPATQQGQYDYLVKLTQEIIDGGGSGIFYWEPAWITSDIKTQWGQGSAWENNALFDFDGKPVKGMNYMTYPYVFPGK